ncbi:Kunitz-type serine protease inhibitor 6 like protein [Argiope bruennichi]|uniref:Kunitz-type serine protease inhibitor 6 like protein n=1 Tax=Argiope bruennichi TaxID=94029 RepID=A0A8T0ENB7_ARGBR|nr:Kunitz-type serine protease inhibitor 6 like protein [Argiope bruennichi]
MAKLTCFLVLVVVVLVCAEAIRIDPVQPASSRRGKYFPEITRNDLDEKCPESYGIFPVKSDCHKFMVCNDGIPIIKTCPEKYVYRDANGACIEGDKCPDEAIVWKAYADQNDEDGDILYTTQNNREIKCGKNYAQYPNFEDCSTYIVCQNGQKKIKSCPAGQHYNDQTIRCEEPCKAYCNKTLSCECKWSTCGLDDACFQMKIIGPCRARIPRYFFNKRAGECQRFAYSGCMGNENNFETLEECQQKCSKDKPKPIPSFQCPTMNGLFPNPDNCRTFFQCSHGKPHFMSCPSDLHFSNKTKRCEKPCDAYCDKSLSCDCKWPTCGLDDLCFLPAETGPCRAGFDNYFFNWQTGQCEEFPYGGCEGNKNNFEKKEDCEQACTKDKPKPIPSFQCLKKNGLFANPDDCRTFFQCTNFKPNLMSCHSGLHFNDKTERCEKPCDAYCDKKLSCECKWPTCGLDDLCFLPPEVGPCRAGFYNYHFNRRTGQCEKFLYGGCRGNKNNFDTKEKCEKACSKKNSDDFTCVKDGLYKDPESCSSYIHCVNGQKYIMPCPRGFHFIEREKFCEPDSEAQCDLKGDAGSELLCTEEGLWSDIEDCHRFINCSHGQREIMSCPMGLHFNEESKECESPCDARCDTSLAAECAWPLGEEKDSDPECEKDGKFMDVSSCSRYIECSNGRKSVKSCPRGLHFSEETEECDSPCDAHCDQSLTLICGWPVGSEKDDKSCPENEHTSLCGAACQRNCQNYKDWFFPCPLICRPGCVCNKGFVRNSEGKCIPSAECDGFKCPFPNGKFLYPADDRKYIKCKDNELTIEECPLRHKFNYLEEKCV